VERRGEEGSGREGSYQCEWRGGELSACVYESHTPPSFLPRHFSLLISLSSLISFHLSPPRSSHLLIPPPFFHCRPRCSRSTRTEAHLSSLLSLSPFSPFFISYLIFYLLTPLTSSFLLLSFLQAEVQQVNSDGGVALHTRSNKYGKLAGGQLLVVPANLVKRQKQHFVSMQALGERKPPF
jgi:hypothetical protein